ncbi:MAG TPA: methyltransferase domain-containing protein [Candidatus Acidoferrales bacterium]|nr:methyltransferase domain-containing protein [Candidatus Acidoferrales bacterium]
MIPENLIQILACPSDRSRLSTQGDALVCERGHTFPVEGDIPIFTDAVRREATPKNMEAVERRAAPDGTIDPFVNDWLVNTNGNLYKRARGRLTRYPIPQWPLAPGDGKVVVDVGCSWGRWSVAAARAGYFPVGLDVHMDALTAAKRVSRELRAKTSQVCGDVSVLPFRPGAIDAVFSYSVLQHIDREKVRRFFGEVARVLRPGGVCLVQLPNAFGLYSIVRQARRGFREAATGTFEMRYWTRGGIQEAIEEAGLRDLRLRADGFFSQDPQLSDLDLLSPAAKLVVLASHAGKRAADALPPLVRFADSLWVEARAPVIEHSGLRS